MLSLEVLIRDSFGENKMIRLLILRLLSLAMKIIDTALWVYVISSWLVNVHPTIWKINRFLGGFFEPFLAPIRKLLFPITRKIGLDFSVYVLAILLSWLMNIAYDIIYMIL